MSEIKLSVENQELQGGWMVMNLKRLEVTVTVAPANYESRKVTAELEMPESSPLPVALQIFPGVETKPENTLDIQNVYDKAQTLIQDLEKSIQEAVNNAKQGGW